MRYGIGRRTWRLSALRQLPKPVVLLFALLIGGLSLQTVPANAVGTVVAGFEIDGNIATNGNHDWQDIGVTPFDDMVGGSDVTTFTSSSKENDVSSWSLGANGAPPPKVDIGYHAGYIARDGGVVSGGGNTSTWTGISVAPGETQTLSYTVVVDATAPAGTITNTATWTVDTITVTGSTTHTITAGGGGGGGGGGLPFTGSNVSANMGAAAVALTAGLALMRRRRRTSGE